MKNGPYEMLIAPKGYPGKRYRGKYAYEHHLIWWKAFGLIPEKGYEIHHINGNHRDNRLENLTMVTGKQHRVLHGELRTKKATLKTKCGFCNKTLSILKSRLKTRLGQNQYGKVFCNRSCGAKHQFKLPGG